jgi:FkbM family methyltransferase
MKVYSIGQIDGKMELRDELDLFGFMQNGVYEPEETEIVKKFVNEKSCCLDIGANIGYYTILMAKLGAWVHSFEPEPFNYKVLKDNIAANDLWSKVSLYNNAVSSSIHQVNFYEARVGQENINYGMGRMYKSKWCKQEPIIVDTVTIDSLEFHEPPTFIKMDAEGWEYFILLGGIQTITLHKPTMLIEFHPPTLKEAETNPEDVYNFLRDRGYKIYLVPNLDKPISYDNLVRETSLVSGRNILCSVQK